MPLKRLRRKKSALLLFKTASEKPRGTVSPGSTERPANSNFSLAERCSHQNMTRLWTRTFKCNRCLKVSGSGWLWRCIEDEEALLEDEIARGIRINNTIDETPSLNQLYEASPGPIARSPAARANRFSFLDEVSTEQLATYSPAQLKFILEQRADVLELARCEAERVHSEHRQEHGLMVSIWPFNRPPRPSSAAVNLLTGKPWLPVRGRECQYKVCPSCAPKYKERTYLNLDAIVNGDIPSTSLARFGFHLQGYLPVANAAIVQNLGCRPNPPVSLTPK